MGMLKLALQQRLLSSPKTAVWLMRMNGVLVSLSMELVVERCSTDFPLTMFFKMRGDTAQRHTMT
jgi:hypothetical protein